MKRCFRRGGDKAAVTALDSVDVLVNCAGATKRGDFFQLSQEDWSNGFALKFFGAVQLSKVLWPALKRSGGSIVNIAGLGARMPSGDFTIGGSVNSALLNFTKTLSEIGSVTASGLMRSTRVSS